MVSQKCFLLSKTVALCAAFFVLGLSIAIPGPTLLDLMKNLNTDVATMSTVYVARSSGYLIGSVTGGFLFDKFNRVLLLFLSLLATAISMSSIPWFKSVWMFSTAMVVVGTTTGFLDTGGNVLCLDTWGKKSGPYMQALHFSFGFGALAAPLLAQPFLEQQQEAITLNDSLHANLARAFPTAIMLNETSLDETTIANSGFESLDRFGRSLTNEQYNTLQYTTLNNTLPTVIDKLLAKPEASGNSELHKTTSPDWKYSSNRYNESESPFVLTENIGDFKSNMRNASGLTNNLPGSLPSLNQQGTHTSGLQHITFSTESPQIRSHSEKLGTSDNDTGSVNAEIEESTLSNMQLLYLIVGLMVFSVSLVFLGFLCYNSEHSETMQEDGLNPEPKIKGAVFLILVGLLSLLFFLYVGMEVAYGQLILTSSVKGALQLSKTAGSYLTATFWGFFALMRFLAIFFSRKFSPLSILIFDFSLCTAGTVVLCIFGDSVEVMLWIGSALLGAGFASVFPTGILWIERYIPITNKVASAFVVGAAMGEMFCPWVVGHYLDVAPMILIYAVTLGNMLCIVTFAVMWLLASKHSVKYVVNTTPGKKSLEQQYEEEMVPMKTARSTDDVRQSMGSNSSLVNGNKVLKSSDI